MKSKGLTVKLLTHTAHPLETLYLEWKASRTDDPIPSAGYLSSLSPEERKSRCPDFDDVVATVMKMQLPVMETIDFVFLIENMPVTLREQLVRHRVGHRFGEHLGADLIPYDPGYSSFWSQTMRVRNMSRFFDEGNYLLPATVTRDPVALSWYEHCLVNIQVAYQKLLEQGVPVEDARNVLPLAMTHRMSWKVNLSALVRTLGKRSCWIAQLGIWEPLIYGIVDELEKLHPVFRGLLDPPCFHHGEWAGCAYPGENVPRCEGKDPFPPCSLYVNLEVDAKPWTVKSPTTEKMYEDMMSAYKNRWGRDPVTGVKISG